MIPVNSRRKFLAFFFRSLPLGALVVGSLACNNQHKSADKKSDDPCSDLSGLTEDDIRSRKNLGYQEKALLKDKRCVTCSLFLPPGSSGDCGKCTLFKGPVHPEGTCTYWVAKNADA